MTPEEVAASMISRFGSNQAETQARRYLNSTDPRLRAIGNAVYKAIYG